MKAAIQYAPFDVRMEEVPYPQLNPGEVIVKIKAAGICGSDVHFFEGVHPYKMYPRIHGHELAGKIVQIADDVTTSKVGDRVVIEPLLACGTCYPCRKGKYNCCVNLEVIGAHVDGGFAEYLAVPAKKVHPIPEGMPFDLAATCEPYTIGHHSTLRAGITRGETVLILGAGAIGLTAIDFAKIRGARVLVAEVSAFRQEMARKFGADVVIDPSKQDLLKVVLELTNGEGAAAVIEATGVTAVMESTENLVAAGGTIVIAGLTTDKVAFTGINFTKREMNILGTRNSAGEFPAVIEAIASGKTHAHLLITKRFSFNEMVEALEYTTNNMASEGKVIIEF
jgi:L-gulonate 5-dehydrogenase